MIVGERERERDDKLEKLLPGILLIVCTLKHRFRRKKKNCWKLVYFSSADFSPLGSRNTALVILTEKIKAR